MFAHKLLPAVTAAAVAAGVLAVGGRATAQPPRQFGRMGVPSAGFGFKPVPYFPPKPVFVAKPVFVPKPVFIPKPVFVQKPFFGPVVTPFPTVIGVKPVAPVYPYWWYKTPAFTSPYLGGYPVMPAGGFGWPSSYWFGW